MKEDTIEDIIYTLNCLASSLMEMRSQMQSQQNDRARSTQERIFTPNATFKIDQEFDAPSMRRYLGASTTRAVYYNAQVGRILKIRMDVPQGSRQYSWRFRNANPHAGGVWQSKTSLADKIGIGERRDDFILKGIDNMIKDGLVEQNEYGEVRLARVCA